MPAVCNDSSAQKFQQTVQEMAATDAVGVGLVVSGLVEWFREALCLRGAGGRGRGRGCPSRCGRRPPPSGSRCGCCPLTGCPKPSPGTANTHG